ncbi:hypothetical protein [Pseudomonas carnis]|uniref:hypothetical protein n=1 Tax=Pseudomonas carnis TaxID=2487355 RepID=UPI001F26FF3E|nr:hypothetical protein [Pseudomonas carnis]
MSPVRRDELGASYASQLVACVVLVIGVAVSMGLYIARLNAHLDEQRNLTSVYLPDCPDGRGGFMVYPDDRRSGDECYTAHEAMSCSGYQAGTLRNGSTTSCLQFNHRARFRCTALMLTQRRRWAALQPLRWRQTCCQARSPTASCAAHQNTLSTFHA